ncbi:DMP19 family protein [Tabrizicola sp.]|uniref:DMP19 family protein n=1 Tax=Tabrizicola sp. TaxID=2005166 RepID=UPI003F2CE90C
MLARLVAVTAAGVMAALPAAADPCKAGAKFTYPVTEIIQTEAALLSVAYYLAIASSDTDVMAALENPTALAKAYRDTVLAETADLDPVERDVRLLGLLAWQAQGGNAALTLTTHDSAGMFDDWLAVLDRRGLTEHAQILRAAKALFPIWGDDPQARYHQWSDDQGNELDPVLGDGLRDLSARFEAAEPPLLEAAKSLAMTQPALKARYQKMVLAADDYALLTYLSQNIGGCAGDWWDAAEADASLARLPQAHVDLIVTDFFIAESLNGSAHQFFYNASGTVAPQVRDALRRMGLPEHAAAIERGMAVFPAPYPRDTEARRAVMSGFTEAQDNQLYDLTGYADDGMIFEAMIKLAKAEGLWPTPETLP